MKKFALALCFALAAPALAQTSKELIAAFNAVKRIPLVEMPGDADNYNARRLDAEKALDTAKSEVKTDEEKKTYTLLKATMESRSLSHLDIKFGDLALQCSREAFLVFSPEDLDKEAVEAAKKGTCLANYRKTVDAIMQPKSPRDK